MSENDVTKEQIDALAADVPSAAVDDANNRAAPTNFVDQAIATIYERLAQLEHVIGSVLPLAGSVVRTAAVLVPGASPVLARLSAIESFAEQLFTAWKGNIGVEPPAPPTGPDSTPESRPYASYED